MKVSILDYGAGNITSIKNAFSLIKVETRIIKNPSEILNSEMLVFPGVGSFGFAMNMLNKTGNADAIKEFIKAKKPFLGICLGMQLLFESSEESPGDPGLKIIKGKVIKFREGKIPQIGWNKIIPAKKNKCLNEGYGYFVNSFFAVPEDKKVILSKSIYYKKFVSGIQKENITAFQFHPERSGKYGINILKRWFESFQKE